MSLERRDALWQETMALTAPVSGISPFRTRPLATLSSTTSAKRTAIETPTLSPSAPHGTSTSRSLPPATLTCSPNWKPLEPFPRAAAKIRISLNYVNGFTPIDNNIPSKKMVNYAASGSSIADGSVNTPTLQSMNSFTEQNTGAGNSNQFILYSYANDWTKDTSRESYVLINVPVKDADGNTTTQNYYKIPVNYRLSDGSTGQTENLYKLK